MAEAPAVEAAEDDVDVDEPSTEEGAEVEEESDDTDAVEESADTDVDTEEEETEAEETTEEVSEEADEETGSKDGSPIVVEEKTAEEATGSEDEASAEAVAGSEGTVEETKAGEETGTDEIEEVEETGDINDEILVEENPEDEELEDELLSTQEIGGSDEVDELEARGTIISPVVSAIDEDSATVSNGSETVGQMRESLSITTAGSNHQGSISGNLKYLDDVNTEGALAKKQGAGAFLPFEISWTPLTSGTADIANIKASVYPSYGESGEIIVAPSGTPSPTSGFTADFTTASSAKMAFRITDPEEQVLKIVTTYTDTHDNYVVEDVYSLTGVTLGRGNDIDVVAPRSDNGSVSSEYGSWDRTAVENGTAGVSGYPDTQAGFFAKVWENYYNTKSYTNVKANPAAVGNVSVGENAITGTLKKVTSDGEAGGIYADAKSIFDTYDEKEVGGVTRYIRAIPLNVFWSKTAGIQNLSVGLVGTGNVTPVRELVKNGNITNETDHILDDNGGYESASCIYYVSQKRINDVVFQVYTEYTGGAWKIQNYDLSDLVFSSGTEPGSNLSDGDVGDDANPTKATVTSIAPTTNEDSRVEVEDTFKLTISGTINGTDRETYEYADFAITSGNPTVVAFEDEDLTNVLVTIKGNKWTATVSGTALRIGAGITVTLNSAKLKKSTTAAEADKLAATYTSITTSVSVVSKFNGDASIEVTPPTNFVVGSDTSGVVTAKVTPDADADTTNISYVEYKWQWSAPTTEGDTATATGSEDAYYTYATELTDGAYESSYTVESSNSGTGQIKVTANAYEVPAGYLPDTNRVYDKKYSVKGISPELLSTEDTITKTSNVTIKNLIKSVEVTEWPTTLYKGDDITVTSSTTPNLEANIVLNEAVEDFGENFELAISDTSASIDSSKYTVTILPNGITGSGTTYAVRAYVQAKSNASTSTGLHLYAKGLDKTTPKAGDIGTWTESSAQNNVTLETSKVSDVKATLDSNNTNEIAVGEDATLEAEATLTTTNATDSVYFLVELTSGDLTTTNLEIPADAVKGSQSTDPTTKWTASLPIRGLVKTADTKTGTIVVRAVARDKNGVDIGYPVKSNVSTLSGIKVVENSVTGFTVVGSKTLYSSNVTGTASGDGTKLSFTVTGSGAEHYWIGLERTGTALTWVDAQDNTKTGTTPSSSSNKYIDAGTNGSASVYVKSNHDADSQNETYDLVAKVYAGNATGPSSTTALATKKLKDVVVKANPIKSVTVSLPGTTDSDHKKMANGEQDDATATITVSGADIKSIDVDWTLVNQAGTEALTDTTVAALRADSTDRTTVSTKASKSGSNWIATVPVKAKAASGTFNIRAKAIATMTDGTLVSLGGWDVSANGATYVSCADTTNLAFSEVSMTSTKSVMYTGDADAAAIPLTIEVQPAAGVDMNKYVFGTLEWTGDESIGHLEFYETQDSSTKALSGKIASPGTQWYVGEISKTGDNYNKITKTIYVKPASATNTKLNGTLKFTAYLSSNTDNHTSYTQASGKNTPSASKALSVLKNPVASVSFTDAPESLVKGDNPKIFTAEITLEEDLKDGETPQVRWEVTENQNGSDVASTSATINTESIEQKVDGSGNKVAKKWTVTASIAAPSTATASSVKYNMYASVVDPTDHTVMLGHEVKATGDVTATITSNLLTKVSKMNITNPETGVTVENLGSTVPLYVAGKSALVTATIQGESLSAIQSTTGYSSATGVAVKFAAADNSGGEVAINGVKSDGTEKTTSEANDDIAIAKYADGVWTASVYVQPKKEKSTTSTVDGESVKTLTPITVSVAEAYVYSASGKANAIASAGSGAKNEKISSSDTTKVQLTVDEALSNVEFDEDQQATLEKGIAVGQTLPLTTRVSLNPILDGHWKYVHFTYTWKTNGATFKNNATLAHAAIANQSDGIVIDSYATNQTINVYVPQSKLNSARVLEDTINITGGAYSNATKDAVKVNVELVTGTPAATPAIGNFTTVTNTAWNDPNGISTGDFAVANALELTSIILESNTNVNVNSASSAGQQGYVPVGDTGKVRAEFLAANLGADIHHIKVTWGYSGSPSLKPFGETSTWISDVTNNESGNGVFSSTLTLPAQKSIATGAALTATVEAYSKADEDAENKIYNGTITTTAIGTTSAIAKVELKANPTSILETQSTIVTATITPNTRNIGKIELKWNDSDKLKITSANPAIDETTGFVTPTLQADGTYVATATVRGAEAGNQSISATVNAYGRTNGEVDKVALPNSGNSNVGTTTVSVGSNVLTGFTMKNASDSSDDWSSAADDKFFFYENTEDYTELNVSVKQATGFKGGTASYVNMGFTWVPDTATAGEGGLQIAAKQADGTWSAAGTTASARVNLASNAFSTAIRLYGSGTKSGHIEVTYDAFTSQDGPLGVQGVSDSADINVRQNPILATETVKVNPTEIPFGGKAQATWLIKSPYTLSDEEMPEKIKVEFSDAKKGTSGYVSPITFSTSEATVTLDTKTAYNAALGGFEVSTTFSMSASSASLSSWVGQIQAKATALDANSKAFETARAVTGKSAENLSAVDSGLTNLTLTDVGTVAIGTKTKTLTATVTTKNALSSTNQAEVTFTWVPDDEKSADAVTLTGGAAASGGGRTVGVTGSSTTGTAAITLNIAHAGSGHIEAVANIVGATSGAINRDSDTIQIQDYLDSVAVEADPTLAKDGTVVYTGQEIKLTANVTGNGSVKTGSTDVKGVRVEFAWDGTPGAVALASTETSEFSYIGLSSSTTAITATKTFRVVDPSATGKFVVKAVGYDTNTVASEFAGGTQLGYEVSTETKSIATEKNAIGGVSLTKNSAIAGDFVVGKDYDGSDEGEAKGLVLGVNAESGISKEITKIDITITPDTTTKYGTATRPSIGGAIPYTKSYTGTDLTKLLKGEEMLSLKGNQAYVGDLKVEATAYSSETAGSYAVYGKKITGTLPITIKNKQELAVKKAGGTVDYDEKNPYNVIAGKNASGNDLTVDVISTSDSNVLVIGNINRPAAADVSYEVTEGGSYLQLHTKTNSSTAATFTATNNTDSKQTATVKVTVKGNDSYYEDWAEFEVAIWPQLASTDLVLTDADGASLSTATKVAAGRDITIDLSKSLKAVIPNDSANKANTYIKWEVQKYTPSATGGKGGYTTDTSVADVVAVEGTTTAKVSVKEGSEYDGQLAVRATILQQRAAATSTNNAAVTVEAIISTYAPLSSISVANDYKDKDANGVEKATIYLNETAVWGTYPTGFSSTPKSKTTKLITTVPALTKDVTYNVIADPEYAEITPLRETIAGTEGYYGSFSVKGKKLGRINVTIQATKDEDTVETAFTLNIASTPMKMTLPAATSVFEGGTIDLSQIINADTIGLSVNSKALTAAERTNTTFEFSYPDALDDSVTEKAVSLEGTTLRGLVAGEKATIEVKAHYADATGNDLGYTTENYTVSVVEPLDVSKIHITNNGYWLRYVNGRSVTPEVSSNLTTTTGVSYEWAFVDATDEGYFNTVNKKVKNPTFTANGSYRGTYPKEVALTMTMTHNIGGTDAQASQIITSDPIPWTMNLTDQDVAIDGLEVLSGTTSKEGAVIRMSTASKARELTANALPYGVQNANIAWAVYSDATRTTAATASTAAVTLSASTGNTISITPVKAGTAYVRATATKTGSTAQTVDFEVNVVAKPNRPVVGIYAQDDTTKAKNLAGLANGITVGETYNLEWSVDGKSEVPAGYTLGDLATLTNNDILDNNGNKIGTYVDVNVDAEGRGTITGLVDSTTATDPVLIGYSLVFTNEEGVVEDTVKSSPTTTGTAPSVVVVKNDPITKLTLSTGEKATVTPNGGTLTISAATTPANAAGVTYKWSIEESADNGSSWTAKAKDGTHLQIEGSDTGSVVNITGLAKTSGTKKARVKLVPTQNRSLISGTSYYVDIDVVSSNVEMTGFLVTVDGKAATGAEDLAKSRNASLNNAAGSTMSLGSVITPANASGVQVEWIINNTGLLRFQEGTEVSDATVRTKVADSIVVAPVENARGIVRVIAMATDADGNTQTYTVNITVAKVSLKSMNIAVEGFEGQAGMIAEDTISTRTELNETTLVLVGNPKTADLGDVTWKVLTDKEAKAVTPPLNPPTSDPETITLTPSNDGKSARVRGLLNGNAYVQATSVVDGVEVASSYFNVKVDGSTIKPTHLYLNTNAATLKINSTDNQSTELSVSYLPSGADPGQIKWTVTGTTAAVELSKTTGAETTVTAKAAGTATVTPSVTGAAAIVSPAAATITVESDPATTIDGFKVSDYTVSTDATGQKYALVPRKAELTISAQGFFKYTSASENTPAGDPKVTWAVTKGTADGANITSLPKLTQVSAEDTSAVTMTMPDAATSEILLTATTADGSNITKTLAIRSGAVLTGSDFVVSKIEDMVYTGKENKAAFTITYNGEELKEGADYSVNWPADVTNAGNVEATIGAGTNGRFSAPTGTQTPITVKYAITPADMKNVEVAIKPATYTGAAQTAALQSATLNGVDVANDIQIATVKQTDANAKGYDVAVSAKTGNIEGTQTAKFVINPKNVTNDKNVTVALKNLTYNMKSQKTTVTVKDGKTAVKATNYTTSNLAGTNAGTYKVTVTFKGNYTGKKTASFKINPLNVSKLSISKIANQTYTGSELKPAPTVKHGSTTLRAGSKTYKLTYANTTNVAKSNSKKAPTVRVIGQGNYTGSKNIKFNINAADLTKAKGVVITLAKKSYKYTGKAIKPAVKKVVYGKKTLKAKTDYTVSYKNNKKVGTKAQVVITFRGNYTGKKPQNFTIKK